MKIFFLNDDFPPFGFSSPGFLTFNFAQKLKEQGHKIFILTTSQAKNFKEKEVINGLTYYRVYTNYHIRWREYFNLYNWQIVNIIEKIFKEVKPDITHLQNIHQFLSYQSINIAKRYSHKVFLTAHDYQLFSFNKLDNRFLNRPYTFFDGLGNARFRFNPLRNLIIKKIIKKIDKIFVLSKAQQKIFELNNINNTEVLYNAIDLTDWQTNEEDLKKFKEKHDLIGKKIIFFGGRLSLEKGLGQIIKSFALVSNQLNNAVLLIAGEKNALINECLKNLDPLVGKNVIVTGWLERQELKIALQAADLVVTPSIYPDPFNMLNLEAMAVKKPVVGTCYGGTPEIVINNETGYIIDPLNEKEMAEKIVEILTDENKAKVFGENGYQRAKEYFSFEKQIETLMNYY